MENDETIRVNIRTGTSTRLPRVRENETLSFEEKTSHHPVIEATATFTLEMDHPDTTYYPIETIMHMLNYDPEMESFYNSNELRRNRNIILNILSHKCKNSELDKECSICQNKFKLDDMVSQLNCNHIFHHKCIQEWGKYKQQCPLCRTEIPVL